MENDVGLSFRFEDIDVLMQDTILFTSLCYNIGGVK